MDNHAEIMRILGNIEGSQNAIAKDILEVKELKREQNGRIGKLENWRSYILGGMAIISFAVIPLVIYIFLSSVSQVRAEVRQLKK